ncbi:tail length tape measure protein [Salmonella enterica subsp. enterica]|uniref:Tail length tape measure protein n=1 Tax=Salmonella enterica I TaxID=59201 RepID=A0A379W9T3_SALET|nr:tail length tape measure protein [Salmonella enterica subsp. enterica]
MSGLVSNISDALAGNKVDWEDWASSVLQSMQKIILNAMLVDSCAQPVTAVFSVQSAVCLGRAQALYLAVLRPALTTQQRQDFNLTQKGGAYASASLSAYSNSIVSSPTYFAFAKGAGLMGEAGPKLLCR